MENAPKLDNPLKEINGIYLTGREVDIISCMLCGRVQDKAIAEWLSVTPKTVESHIRNIMLKLTTSSRTRIIDWIEKSDKAPLFREHYTKMRGSRSEGVTEEQPSFRKQPYRHLFSRILHSKKILFLSAGATLVCLFLQIYPNRQHTPSSLPQVKRLSIRATFPLPPFQYLFERKELRTIQDLFAKQKDNIKCVALVGIGGAGKTTLARQYASAQNASIVWELNAESQESFFRSLELLATEIILKSPEKKLEFYAIQQTKKEEERGKKVLAFVKNYLKNNTWVLLYDNLEIFPEIQSFLPLDPNAWGVGQVIITTRDQSLSTNLIIPPQNCIHIGELTLEDKKRFFRKIIGHPPSPAEEKEETAILQQVPGSPLELVSTADTMKHANLSYDQYRRLMQNHSREMHQLRTERLKYFGDYKTTFHSTITLLINQLLKKNTSYAPLLWLISLLDSQSIPQELLYVSNDIVLANQLLHDLKKISFITMEKSTLSIHRSAQHILLNFLRQSITEEEQKKVVDRFLSSLVTYQDKNLDTNLERFGLLIPHLQKFQEQLKSSYLLSPSREEMIALLLGNLYNETSPRNIIKAKQYFRRFVDLSKHTSSSPSLIAHVLFWLGELDIALDLPDEAILDSQQSLALCKSPENQTLMAQNVMQIGAAYAGKNNFPEAVTYLKQSLHIMESCQDIRKPEYLSRIYQWLSSVYGKMDLTEEASHHAELYAKKALEVLGALKRFEGTKPSQKLPCDVARGKWRLGQAYIKEGLYAAAITDGFREANYIIDFRLDNCPHELLRAQLWLGLGEALLRQGHLQEAEENLKKSIERFEITSGIAESWKPRALLVETYMRLQKWTEAYEECCIVLNIPRRSRNKGLDLLYLTNMYHAAFITYQQENYKQSEKHCMDFIKAAQLLLKENLSFPASSTSDESIKNHLQERLKKIREMLIKAYGPSHSQTIHIQEI